MDHKSLSIVLYLEGREGWWFCLVVVAQWSELWQLKPGVLGSIPSDCQLFTFLYCALLPSNSSYEALKLTSPSNMFYFQLSQLV